MRKVDYQTLAEIVAAIREEARACMDDVPFDSTSYKRLEARRIAAEDIARQFSSRASVDAAEFLRACRLQP